MHLLSIIIVAMSVCCCVDGSGWAMPIVSDANVTIFAEINFHFGPFSLHQFSVYSFVHSFELRIRLYFFFVSERISIDCKCFFKMLFRMVFHEMLTVRSLDRIYCRFYINKNITCHKLLGLSLQMSSNPLNTIYQLSTIRAIYICKFDF